MAPQNRLYRSIGLESLPSCEGVVAALLDTDGRDEIHSLGGISHPYDAQLRWRVMEATQNDLATTEVLRLERALTEHHLRAVAELQRVHSAAFATAAVIGFSGHTMRHLPSEGLTLELGNPWLLATGTGLPVVSDFRRHDMSIGGEGAPLSAMFHWALMAQEPRPALMLNLDTTASVVWLSTANEIIAGDTGPGVGLLNEWVQEMAARPHDLDGALASDGRVNDDVVRQALTAPFFDRPLPKAADRNLFDQIDVSGLSVEDGAATLCAITIEACRRAVERLPAIPRRVWVTGVGSRHPVLVRMLESIFTEVRSVAARGLNPDTLGAESYAWLAVRYLRRLPITTPETTGCRQAQCAGISTLAPTETQTF
jgi:anhydro-N-acetylmuramic acid kinase